MAGMYDEQGNYIGDDGSSDNTPVPAYRPTVMPPAMTGNTPSIDQMKYELAKKKPLDHVATTMRQMVEAPAALGDIARTTLLGYPAMIGSALSSTLGNIQNKGAAAAYRALGDEDNAQRIESQPVESASDKFSRWSQTLFAPSNQTSEDFQRAISPVTEKLPLVFPGLHPMPGKARATFTPNDARALLGEANRVGTQVKDIPTDFANAQSGFTRIDPITGKPTYGAKLQSAADAAAEVMERRRMQGLNPVPGVPDVFQPETQLYAVRRPGGTMTNPKFEAPTVEQLTDRGGASNVIQELRPLSKDPNPHDIVYSYIKHQMSPDDESAYRNFVNKKNLEEFPDTQSSSEAQRAAQLKYNTNDTRNQRDYDLLNEFISENADNRNLIPIDEHVKRAEAGNKWLESAFYKSMYKYLGTVEDPMLKLAAQGHTYVPAQTLIEDYKTAHDSVKEKRKEAGFNPEGEYYKPLKDKQNELTTLTQQLNDLEQKRMVLSNRARTNGLPDPAMDPEYAATTAPRDKLNRDIAKAKDEESKLQLAHAYENMADTGIMQKSAQDMWDSIPNQEKQFYPQLRQLAAEQPNAPVFDIRGSNIRYSGLQSMAEDYVQGILHGDIPVNKIDRTPIDAYVRGISQKRLDAEKARQKAAQEYVGNVQKTLINRIKDVPPELTFARTKALEVDNKLPVDQIRKDLSADTEVLDHCIAQVGSAPRGTRNVHLPENKDERSYLPTVDLLTGAKNRPDAGDTSYIQEAEKGASFFTSLRDKNTGYPVVTLQFHRLHTDSEGKDIYQLGYASGHQNGAMDHAYKDDLRDYMNKKSDIVNDTGSALTKNGVYDTKSLGTDFFRDVGTDRDTWTMIKQANPDMPRFITDSDARKMVAESKDNSLPELDQMLQARDRLQYEMNELTYRYRNGQLNDTGVAHYEDLEHQLNDLVSRIERAQRSPDRIPIDRVSDAIERPTDHEDTDNILSELYRRVARHDEHGVMTRANLRQVMLAIDNHMVRIDTADENELPELGITEQGDNHARRVSRELENAMTRLQDILDEHNALETQQTQQRRMGTANQQIYNAFNDPLRTDVGHMPDMAINFLRHTFDEAHQMAVRLVGEGRNPSEIAREIRSLMYQYRDAMISRQQATPEQRQAVGLIRERLSTAADNLHDIAYPEQQAVAEAPAQPQIPNIPNYITNIRQVIGAATGDRIETVVYRTAENINPNTQPFLFAQALREAANREENGLVEQHLNELADMFDHPNAEQQEPNLFGDLEPDQGHPANQPAFDSRAMAVDLLEQERQDNGRLHEPSVEDSINALRANMFDDPRIRDLPENQREIAANQVANYLQGMLDTQREQQQREQLRIQPVDLIPTQIRNETLDQLTEHTPDHDLVRPYQLVDEITDTHGIEQLHTLLPLIRNYAMSEWSNFSYVQRELLARAIEEYIQDNSNPPPGYAKGGRVHKPSVDQMRYELMMRRA